MTDADLRAALTDEVLASVIWAYNRRCDEARYTAPAGIKEAVRYRRSEGFKAARDVLVAALTAPPEAAPMKIGESLGLSENLIVVPKPDPARPSEAGAALDFDTLETAITACIRPIDGGPELVCEHCDMKFLGWRHPDTDCHIAEALKMLDTLRAARPALPATGTGAWQPIEAHDGDTEHSVIGWGPTLDEPVEAARYRDLKGWFTRAGTPITLTHWQPLPPAPTTERG